MAFTAQQSRVDALLRLMGMVVFAFGAALIYYSYLNAAVPGIAPEIITVNYALGLLLVVIGLLVVLARFK